MGGVLIVTWLGGGATQPAIGRRRELSARGHRVGVLAPARFARRIAAAGCEHVAHPAVAEFNPGHGRAMEDQSPFLEATFFGPWLTGAVAEQVAADRPDVVVVDYLLLGRRADRALVVLPPAFDSWPDSPPSVVHTGPIAEEAGPAPWVPPWPDGGDRPLVVVTCGTTYMHPVSSSTRTPSPSSAPRIRRSVPSWCM